MTVVLIVWQVATVAFVARMLWARRDLFLRAPKPLTQWCPSCRQHWTYLGDPFDAWLTHCRDVCPTTRVQR